jgi:arylsulfatase A
MFFPSLEYAVLTRRHDHHGYPGAGMNRYVRLAIGCGAAVLAAIVRPGFGEESAPPTSNPGLRPPNIVFILADDLGMDLLSCYGSDQFKTPNVDALAASGIRFNYCHTTPVCGPSRCQFLTGQHPFRSSHVENNAHVRTIDPNGSPSLARVLKSAGYATALAGKWHMSKKPEDWGFDESGVLGGGSGAYWIKQGGKTVFKPDLMEAYALDFVRRSAARPFFLWYAAHFVHDPAAGNLSPAAPPELAAQLKQDGKQSQAKQRVTADHLAYLDRQVGRLLAELDALKLRERTLVIFAGDNGTAGIGATMKGRKIGQKRHLQDGGATVPMIAHWPGTTPAGKVCDDLVGFEDFLPTFAELAGTTAPKDKIIDGVSFAPQLRGGKGKPREWIFTQYRDQWFVRDPGRKLYNDGRLMDTTDYPFKEKELPAGAEPEVRRKFQQVVDGLGVGEVMRAHPEWIAGG